MASGQIKRTEIAEVDLYKDVRDSAKKTITMLNKLNTGLKNTGTIIRKDLTANLNKTSQGITKLSNAVKKADTVMAQSVKVDKAKVQAQKAVIQAEREMERLKQDKLKTQKAEMTNAQQLQKIKDKESATLKKNAKAINDQSSAYKKLVIATRDQKNQSKELGAQMLKLEKDGKRNTVAYKNLSNAYRKVTASAKVGDRQLKRLDRTVGDNFRNVGNYRGALGKLSGAFGALGVSMGGAMIIRNVFGVIKDFGQAQADLSSVLGVNKDKMVALTEQSKLLGSTTKFTASEISNLQMELAKLGFTQTEIEAMTESTLLLASATGTELARSAEVAGGIVKAFGLDAKDTGQVVDAMAKSFSTTALDTEKFAETMKASAPIARVAGISMEQATASAGILANNMISGSKAGTDLKTIFSKLAKDGKPLAESLDDVAEKLAKAETPAEKLQIAFDTVGEKSKASLLILAENRGELAKLTTSFESAGGSAQEMADKQLDTLGGALALLQSAWEGFVLSMDEAGGVGDKLKSAIGFLAKNLSNILTAVLFLTKAFIAFKVAMFALKMSGRISDFKQYQKEVKQSGEAMTGAGRRAKGFGKALKGIGLGLAITLILELAKGLYDVASGAAETRRQVDLLASAQVTANKVVDKIIAKSDRHIEREKKLLELQKARNEISPIEFEKKLKILEEDKLKRLEQARKYREDEIKDLSVIDFKLRKKAREDIKRLQTGGAGQGTGSAIRGVRDKLKKDLQENNDLIRFKTETEKALRIAIQDTNDTVHDYTVNIANNSFETNLNTDAIKDNNDELSNKLSLMKAIRDLEEAQEDVVIEDIEKGIDEETETQGLSARFTGEFDLDELTKQFDLLEAEKKKKAVDSRDFEIELAKSTIKDKELLRIALMKIEFEYQQDLKKINSDIKKDKEQTIDILMTKVGEYEESQKDESDALEKKIEKDKKLLNEQLSIIKSLTDTFTFFADKRIAKIDEEIKKSEEKYNRFAELAKNGNINAQQSLAVEAKIIAESNRKKAKLEKQKQRVKLGSDALQAFLRNSEDPDVKNPLLKTFSDITLLTQFIQNLPFFEDGTEDTGKTGNGIDGKGGFLSVLHPNERVVKKEHNAMIGDMSNEELAKMASSHRNNEILGGINGIQIGSGSNNIEVVKRLESLENTLRNKPETNIDFERIIDGAMQISRETKTGNTTIYNRYRIKP